MASNKNKGWTVLRPPLGAGFYLPSREDLLKVKKGDGVKLMFQAGEDAPERMWVQVVKSGNADQWTGRLDNDPAQQYTASVLRYKDKIKFHPLDVINIDSDRDNSPREGDSEQVIDQKLSEATNVVNIKWYKNPNIMVPAIVALVVGLLSVGATIGAALITNK